MTSPLTSAPLTSAPIALPRLLVSAVRKSSGKTLLTLGLTMALGRPMALGRSGEIVQLFKKGPDYIDPMWHQEASGRAGINLDTYMMGEPGCLAAFSDHATGCDLAIVEGNLGLHDGMDDEGRHSSAGLAKLLDAPVLLVVDASGMNRNVAAVVLGMQRFDPDVRLGGVVLNRVRSPRQESKMVRAVERHCGIPVVGVLPTGDGDLIAERHLGLITPEEAPAVSRALASMGDLVAAHVNLEQVRAIGRSAPPLAIPQDLHSRQPMSPQPISAHPESNPPAGGGPPSESPVTLGVARDPAFCFHYRDNLDALERAGAELVTFDCLKDPTLPEVDGLFIAGGFPESFLEALEANASLRRDIAGKIESGLPAYAECGGMMYLTRSITRHGETREMVGVIPADTVFQERPVGYGYVELAPSGASSWLHLDREIRGHEFHYSRLLNLDPAVRTIYEVKRGTGMGEGRDGITHKNLLASYCHLHARAIPEWSRDFVAAMRKYRDAG